MPTPVSPRWVADDVSGLLSLQIDVPQSTAIAQRIRCAALAVSLTELTNGMEAAARRKTSHRLGGWALGTGDKPQADATLGTEAHAFDL